VAINERATALIDADLDSDLLDEAHRLGGLDAIEDTIAEALKEFVSRQKQRAVLDFLGTIDYDPTYDPKEQRMKESPCPIRISAGKS